LQLFWDVFAEGRGINASNAFEFLIFDALMR
jgi:hypothetical protein